MDESTETTPAAVAGEPAVRPRLVVGVDGSDHSLVALRHAARLAQPLGATIEVVTSWYYPVAMSPYAMQAEPSFEQLAHETQEQSLQDAFGADIPDLLTRVVEYGHPAKVLLEHSEGAEMLVLGSRGRGGFAGLLLGSVSSECAAHAKCPVLIVR